MKFYTVQLFIAQYNVYFTVNKSTVRDDSFCLNNGSRRAEAQMSQDPLLKLSLIET